MTADELVRRACEHERRELQAAVLNNLPEWVYEAKPGVSDELADVFEDRWNKHPTAAELGWNG